MQGIGLEFSSRGEVGFHDLGDPPSPAAREILIETVFSGITNGTERHALLTEHGYGGGSFPCRHGYQQVGKIVAVGGGVTDHQVGDYIFYGGYVGHNGWNVVRDDALLITLPPPTDRKYCALFGVAGVALRSVRRMGVGPGDNVWVAGQGPIGHFLAQAACAAGARVTVTDFFDHRLEVAEQCGAHCALNPGDAATEDRIAKEGPYQFIFDCCSDKDIPYVIHRRRMLAHGGTVGLMAVRDEVNYPWSLLHQTEARIETSCHFTNDDLRVLLFLYQKGSIQIKPMVSHIVPIDRAPEMYDLLANRSNEVMGVIFDWAAGS